MKLKAPVLALLVPCAMLAACNRADTTAEREAINDGTAPAAGTGFDGVNQPNSTGTSDLDATLINPPAEGTLREGADLDAGAGTVIVEPMDESRSTGANPVPNPSGASDGSGHPKREGD